MRQRALGLILSLLFGVTISGCIEKVPKNETASDNASSGMTAQAPASSSSSPEASNSPRSNNGRITPDESGQAGGANSSAMPGASGASSSSSSAPSGDAAALKRKADALEAKLRKSPADAKLKKELAEAYYQEGEAIMLDANLPPRMKYKPALLLFNKTLSLDPQHQKAAENKATIEAIYQQMGMPIPQ